MAFSRIRRQCKGGEVWVRTYWEKWAGDQLVLIVGHRATLIVRMSPDGHVVLSGPDTSGSAVRPRMVWEIVKGMGVDPCPLEEWFDAHDISIAISY